MWPQWLGMAGQRLGRRRIWTANLLSVNRHAHDSRAGARGWHFDRSDRLVAGNLLKHFARRVEERQHHPARIRRCYYADSDAYTNTDTDANADSNADADADTDTDTDTNANANANTV